MPDHGRPRAGEAQDDHDRQHGGPEPVEGPHDPPAAASARSPVGVRASPPSATGRIGDRRRAQRHADGHHHDVARHPQPPQLVGREPPDHEQPQVDPDDLPVGGDEHPAGQPVDDPGHHQAAHDRERRVPAASTPGWPAPTGAGVRSWAGWLGLGRHQRLGERAAEGVGRGHQRSTSRSRWLTTLATSEMTSDTTRYRPIATRIAGIAGLPVADDRVGHAHQLGEGHRHARATCSW